MGRKRRRRRSSKSKVGWKMRRTEKRAAVCHYRLEINCTLRFPRDFDETLHVSLVRLLCHNEPVSEIPAHFPIGDIQSLFSWKNVRPKLPNWQLDFCHHRHRLERNKPHPPGRRLPKSHPRHRKLNPDLIYSRAGNCKTITPLWSGCGIRFQQNKQQQQLPL